MACSVPIPTATQWGLIDVPCKQCLPCRISRQSELTGRCLLENSTAVHSAFWTLTYANPPAVGGYGDFQKFLKRLRKANEAPIRYFGCGEYGSKSGRFHFHALIWNNVRLKEWSSPFRDGKVRLHPAWATRLWPHGYSYIGTVTPASIRYTARYTLKFFDQTAEPIAGWSKEPALGAAGMTFIIKRMLDRGDTIDSLPTSISIEGKSYVLGRTMRELTAQVVEFYTGRDIRPSPLNAVHSFHEKRVLGDPLVDQARRIAERNTFWESARFSYGKV